MEKGNRVEITSSDELTQLKLKELNGYKGTIAEVSHSTKGNITGCWVELDNPFENEHEWFIPISSITIVKQE